MSRTPTSDALEAIMTRRSIRSFTDQDVTDTELRTILEAAMNAPSAGNAQPWRFVVIRDQAMKDAITENHAHAKMVAHAPVCLCALGDTKLEKYPGNWMHDCSAAIQNILLAARVLGIGSVWIGISPQEAQITDARKLLDLPESLVPLAYVALGRPEQDFKPADRYKPERVTVDGLTAPFTG